MTVLINAYNFFRSPFIGSFVQHTLIFSQAESVGPNSWEGEIKGLEFGDQLQSIDEVDIHSVDELHQELQNYEIGDITEIITVNLLSIDLERISLSIELLSFPVLDQIAYMVLPFLIGFISIS